MLNGTVIYVQVEQVLGRSHSQGYEKGVWPCPGYPEGLSGGGDICARLIRIGRVIQ